MFFLLRHCSLSVGRRRLPPSVPPSVRPSGLSSIIHANRARASKVASLAPSEERESERESERGRLHNMSIRRLRLPVCPPGSLAPANYDGG